MKKRKFVNIKCCIQGGEYHGSKFYVGLCNDGTVWIKQDQANWELLDDAGFEAEIDQDDDHEEDDDEKPRKDKKDKKDRKEKKNKNKDS